MKVKRLMVAISRDEYETLQRQAEVEKRFAEQQASWLLSRSLSGEQKRDTQPVPVPA